MAPANDAESQRRAVHQFIDRFIDLYASRVRESKQAMTSLYRFPIEGIWNIKRINDSAKIDWNNGDEYLILSKRSTELLRARAAMARPVSEDDSVRSCQGQVCAAWSTLTGSLINASDIEGKVTIIETAGGDDWITSTLKCNKTYFVRNPMGDH
jgi:hypothetical protein